MMKVEKKLKLNFIIIDRAFNSKVIKFLKDLSFKNKRLLRRKWNILDALEDSKNVICPNALN